MNLSPKQIDGLLKMAGSRLGRDRSSCASNSRAAISSRLHRG